MSVAWLAYWLALGLLGVYGAHRIYLTALYWRTREPDADAPLALPAELPVVTVQVPLFNELYVAERLIDAVARLDWPRDLLEIQILDDSTDETSARCRARAHALRQDGFCIRYLHRDDRAGFKAGALTAGLACARGELILILDADFVPPPDLLRATVGHFADPAVGMVQVRWEHLNRDTSVLTHLQALLLDGHFVVEQTVRYRTDRFFNFNGTAGVWRRQAIVDAGGWHCDTLTEDLDLSYRALLRGWRFVYLLQHASPAELPVGMNGFKSQQFRWAKGSIQVARKLLVPVLRAQLPTRVKVEAFFHLTQNVPYLITLILMLAAVPALVLRASTFGETVALHVPALVVAIATLAAYCATSQRALRRSAVAALVYVPALMAVTAGICVSQARAVIEGMCGHRSPFVRTPKLGVVGRRPGRWRRLRYRGVRDLTPLAELMMALYFAAATVLACLQARFLVVPFLILLGSGFAYVGVRSALGR